MESMLAGLRNQHWRGVGRHARPTRAARRKGTVSRALGWIGHKLLDGLVWLLALPLRWRAWRVRRARLFFGAVCARRRRSLLSTLVPCRTASLSFRCAVARRFGRPTRLLCGWAPSPR